MNEKSLFTLRALSADCINNANSGHTGIALGAAPILYALYRNCANICPTHPDFTNRDRIVLSAGHGSALLYSILHLCGYPLEISDLKAFRQLGSKTPGHPEFNLEIGSDCATGPLGQGVACAVGLAMAEKHLASVYNREDLRLIDHYTYVILGEGCLMEGVTYEACSIAGQQCLNKLIALYDCNKVSIDGSTDITFTENLRLRFEAQGWNVIEVEGIDNVDGIVDAIQKAKTSNKPTFIIVPSIIGFGTEYEGTSKIHGLPLTDEELKNLRSKFNLSSEPFSVDKEVYNDFDQVKERGCKLYKEYENTIKQYSTKYNSLYKEFLSNLQGKTKCEITLDVTETITGRDLGQLALNHCAEKINNLFGGTADLVSSTKAYILNGGDFTDATPQGKNIHFGVREFAMGAICNGIALHGGLIPFCSTFLAFSDYLKPAIRMAALMKLKVLYIFTHDSIDVGEDGATHQPIEQLLSLRYIPNVTVFRPASGSEVAFAYNYALNNTNGPTIIVLSKSNLCNYISQPEDMKNGAYEVYVTRHPNAIILASGKEVELAFRLKERLKKDDFDVNIISILSTSLFDQAGDKYAAKLFRKIKTIISLEAGSSISLAKYVGKNGISFGIDNFGESGKSSDLYNKFGFDEETLVKKIESKAKENGNYFESIF